MDSARFELACSRVMHQEQGQNGIGTLAEKTIHAVLKNYYVPEPAFHEQKFAGFVADAYTGEEIYEIQTKTLTRCAGSWMPSCLYAM